MKLSAKQNDVLRQVVFAVLFIIDVLLAINLYLGLGASWEKYVIMAAALAVIGVKILSLLNAVRYKWKIGNRKAILLSFSLYILCATTTIGGSLGYTVTAVERMDEAAAATLSSSSDAIAAKEDLIKNYELSVAENVAAIASNEKELANEKLVSWLRSQLIDSNAKLRSANIGLRDKIATARSEILVLKAEGKKTTAGVKKSMYAIIGDMFKISGKVVALILLGLLSVLIELGLLYTAAPYKEEKEEEEVPLIKKLKEELETTWAEEDKRDTPIVAEASPIIVPPEFSEFVFKGTEVKSDVEVPAAVIEAPEELEELTPVLPSEPEPELIVESPKTGKVFSRAKNPPTLEQALNLHTEERIQDSLPISPRTDANEEIIETPEAPVVRPIQSIPEKFIHALFSNGTKPFLKDKREAAREAGMAIIEATELFSQLAKIRGSKGYPLIEFRNSQWYPNFTSEVIIAYLIKLNLIKK